MRYCVLCKKKFLAGEGSLFKVPKDTVRRAKWSAICGKELKATALLCSDHFQSKSIAFAKSKVLLLPSAEPIVNLPIVSPTISFEASGSQQLEQISAEFSSEGNTKLFTWEQVTSTAAVPAQFNDEHVEELFKEQSTQTDSSIFDFYEGQYQRIRELESEVKDLKLKLQLGDVIIENLKKMFTEGQIRKIIAPKKVMWKWPDISSAICLHASGPRAYNHLYQKGFPLPHATTLTRWCATISINEGLLSESVKYMKHSTNLKLEDKICVLAFDEMKVAETYDYDPRADEVKKPANFVQVIMARGLRSSWKQPVFYDFDCKLTVEIIDNVIRTLGGAGFPVVAMVCDLGASNRKLWRELGVSEEKPWFSNSEYLSEKVFCFADAPHLLKLVRNHFLATGLVINNELLTSRTIVDLLKYTSKSDVSITFKLNEEHLNVRGATKQKVKLAAQLFSHTTANAISRCSSLGMELYKPDQTAEFIQLVNDWFDVFNSRLQYFNYPGKQPYGIDLEAQNLILNNMSKTMSSPIIPQKNSLEIFQRGVLQSNNAVIMLRNYVEKYNMTYLVTNRLNQDVLEHFFGAIRSKGGLNDHPSPRDFKFRLRKYILARNTEILNGKGNVECDNTDWLSPCCSCDLPKNDVIGDKDTGEDLRKLEDIEIGEAQIEDRKTTDDVEVSEFLSQLPEDELVDFTESNFQDINILQEEALEYVSGYIIKKLKLEVYECHDYSFSWVDQVSKVGLKKPKESFLADIMKLEEIFGRINGDTISNHPHLKKRLMENSAHIDLPDHVKNLFYKCRIYFRVRHLNRQLKSQKSWQRKLAKFVR